MSPAPAITNPFARLLRPDPYQDLFRVLADTSEAAILVVSTEADTVLSANHAFLLLTGYSRPEVGSLRASQLFETEGEAAPLADALRRPAAGGAHFQELPLRRREAATLPVDVDVYPAGAGRNQLLLSLRPSSIRQQAAVSRLTLQERMTALARMAAVLADRAAEGLPEALDLARTLLGASALGLYRVSPSAPDYLLHGSLPEAFPPSLPASSIKSLDHPSRWTLGQRPEHVLHKSARAAGFAVLHAAPVGAPTAWIGALVAAWREADAVDEDVATVMELVAGLCDAAIRIGVQRAALADLEKNVSALETELEGQFAAAGEGMLNLDADLCILRANPSAGQLLGYPQRELEGLDAREVLVGPEDVSATLLDALGHDRQAERARLTLHNRDGTPFAVNLRAVPVLQGPTRLLVLFSDQTERKAIEDRTEILAQRALLGEVTAIFAHEVRNPINNISTGVQLIASRLGKDHPLAESLDRIRKECLRLDQLMGDVLFFARPLELKIEPLDLADLTQRLLGRWEPRLRQANVTTHTAFDAATPLAAADPRTLEQVIVNLISNAMQAMAGGGTLSVTLAPCRTQQGAMVELKVADTGPGIPAEIQERIFEPFFTTKKDGTGLGLAISRRILMAHKGTIRVQSFPDAGTVFTIQVPAAETDSGSRG